MYLWNREKHVLRIQAKFQRDKAKKSLPVFKTIKKCTKKSDFQWTTEAKAAFKQMKKLIAELPSLTSHIEKEELIIYVAAAKEAVPRSENKKADALSKIASTSFAHLTKQVLVEELNEKSINKAEVLAVVEEGDIWMTLIYEYLIKEALPAEKKKERASSNGYTPFSLTYGTKVVIPVEIGMPTLRIAKIDMVQNDEALKINLDLLEERREQAAIS
nr:reverse transcriptase domain-containing protein [Tanacetum cinerariifolium]